MIKNRGEKLFSYLAAAFLSLLFGCYVLLMLESMGSGGENYRVINLLRSGLSGSGIEVSRRNIAAGILSAWAAFTVILLLVRGRCRLLRLLLKYRWQVSAVLFLAAVILDVNNTSLHRWTQIWDPALAGETAPFWGVARDIRSDEWATWSVFSLSQEYSGFQAVNPLMSAGAGVETAWISVGGIPALSLTGLFKPLYLGFLLPGISRGFSFLFAARILLLFNVSYEAALKYTRKSVPFSLAAAAMFTLSPYVQWWFSQSIAEVLIFGQGIVLCLMRYLEADRRGSKWLWSILLSYSLGCFIMISYAAWLIAAAWLIIPVCVMLLLQRRSRLGKGDALCLLLPLFAAAGLLGIIVYRSWDTLMAVRNSVYPGERLITGGLFRVSLITDVFSILLPFIQPEGANQCEYASFITFAPLGMILWIWRMFKTRKTSAFDITLAAAEILALLFNYVNIPSWLARITLLSQVNRVEFLFGAADTLLLIRCLSRKEAASWPLALLLAAILGGARIIGVNARFSLDTALIIILGGVYVSVIYAALASGRGKKESIRFAAAALGIIAVLGGGFVNPLHSGLSGAADMQIVRDIKDTDPDRGGAWMVEGNWPATELPLLAGMKTLSTQAYANVPFWKELDPQGQYENEYNRFCHISAKLTEGSDTSFSLLSEDHILLSLNPEDLEKLHIDYLMTTEYYPPDYAEGMKFHFECESDPWIIYKITY